LPIWTNISRSLPTCSLLDIAAEPIQILSLILLALVCISSLAVIVGNHSKFAGQIVLLALGALIILDLNRLQPWVYEYALIILLYSIDGKDSSQSPVKVKYVALLVLAVYFYSGLEKLNWPFLTRIGPWIMGLSPSPLMSMADDNAAIAISSLMTFGEILIPFALLCRKTRILGICMGLVMHITILTALGPGHLNTNAVVWPWNIIQMILMTGCFLKLPINGRSLLTLDRRCNAKVSCVIVVSCLLIPILGLMQLVDPYPAFALYSGDIPRGKLVFKQAAFNKLPAKIKWICHPDKSQNLWWVAMTDWSMVESTAPTYPSRFCLIMMAKHFLRTNETDCVALQIATYPKLTKTEKIENIEFWKRPSGKVEEVPASN